MYIAVGVGGWEDPEGREAADGIWGDNRKAEEKKGIK
jgi:hypothetical protein